MLFPNDISEKWYAVQCHYSTAATKRAAIAACFLAARHRNQYRILCPAITYPRASSEATQPSHSLPFALAMYTGNAAHIFPGGSRPHPWGSAGRCVSDPRIRQGKEWQGAPMWPVMHDRLLGNREQAFLCQPEGDSEPALMNRRWWIGVWYFIRILDNCHKEQSSLPCNRSHLISHTQPTIKCTLH